MAKKIVLFVMACLTWLVLNWPPTWAHLLVGCVIAFFIAYVTGDLFVHGSQFFKEPKRMLLWFFWYTPLVLGLMVRASLRIALRTLQPGLPASPGIVRVRTTLKSDTGLTCLANTITLASGTMTVDVDRENGFLYVHWVHVKSRDMETATRMIVGRFEPLIKQIFE
jgi:multicomponent Na+:H+ antiporter subunit E